jgi:hypothetical protein
MGILDRMQKARIIEIGEIFFHTRLSDMETMTIQLLENGFLLLEEGYIAKSLSEAATYYSKYSVNGWRYWSTKRNGKNVLLYHLRKKHNDTVKE